MYPCSSTFHRCIQFRGPLRWHGISFSVSWPAYKYTIIISLQHPVRRMRYQFHCHTLRYGIPIISGTAKATDIKFCTHINRVHRKPMKSFEKSSRGHSQEFRKFSGHPFTCKARIALSSVTAFLFYINMFKQQNLHHIVVTSTFSSFLWRAVLYCNKQIIFWKLSIGTDKWWQCDIIGRPMFRTVFRNTVYTLPSRVRQK